MERKFYVITSLINRLVVAENLRCHRTARARLRDIARILESDGLDKYEAMLEAKKLVYNKTKIEL